ncbi:MAG: pilus assembly protein PilM [Candidatus Omnitrophica bacterium]|nr:pilus assembly protein PilM [Candidatus Omnitrophota bacterium]
MSALGIYFGPRAINVVETKGKGLVSNIQILQSAITSGELEEKVPTEVKIVALFKDELRKNKVQVNEASLALSGRDMVIRTFEMPVIPRSELSSAIRFEVKKYIPFKIEDLITDFQVQFDKLSRKNLVLFVGIKKETMDKYLSIFNQLDIKVKSIEYAAFSILRLLKLSGHSDRGVINVISADFKEEDEVNFTVLENGFPLFSRDITLSGGPEELREVKEQDSGMLLEKLKTEIRVSLDYYHRKFPAKKIEKAFFVSSQDSRANLEGFIKEMGLPIQFIEPMRFINRSGTFSLSLVKGYSSSLYKVIKSDLKINLLTAKEKLKFKDTSAQAEIAAPLLTGLKVYPKALVGGALICIAAYLFSLYRILPLRQELNSIIAQRTQVPNINPNMPIDELSRLDSEYQQKISSLDDLMKGQTYLTKLLEIIARVKPEGIWLRNFSFGKGQGGAGRKDLTLDGMAYLTDSDKEFALVNKFLAGLKENAVFSAYFKEMNIASLERRPFRKVSVTVFTITCHSVK